MKFYWGVIASPCQLCEDMSRGQYCCQTCQYNMCTNCFIKYLSFKYTSCPQCREKFKSNEELLSPRGGDDIVPSIATGTFKNYIKIYLLFILSCIIYWLLKPDDVSFKMIGYLCFFSFYLFFLILLPAENN